MISRCCEEQDQEVSDTERLRLSGRAQEEAVSAAVLWWGGRLETKRCGSSEGQKGLNRHEKWPQLLSQFSSVAQSCPTFCDRMDCSTPGLPVPHQLPEFTQTHVHWVGDAIQPSHPLLSPSPALNLSQHYGLLQWVSFSRKVAKVLEFQLQLQSFQWVFKTDLLCDGLVGSPWSPRDSQRVFSNTIVQKHQHFGA